MIRYTQKEQAFTLIELLVTMAISVILSSMSVMVYKQYVERAYSVTSLSQLSQTETALQAALADSVSLGASLYSSNRSFLFQIDGELTCLSGCDGINPSNLFPGLSHNRGVQLQLIANSNNQTHSITSAHCKTEDSGSYSGWLAFEGQLPSQVVVSAGDEADECEAVINGGEYTGGSGGASCGNNVTEGAEECDDGNTSNGDGCSSGCLVEDDPVCGNGIVEAGEECDGESCLNGESCSPSCVWEECTLCGNGTVEGLEACDPPGGSCTTDCMSNSCGIGGCTGWETCNNCPADCGACVPVCGDGNCQSAQGECVTCEDDCGTDCSYCGDGYVTALEACDPPGGTCTSDCMSNNCGDGSCIGWENSGNCPADC